jgi:hypothetical protein
MTRMHTMSRGIVLFAGLFVGGLVGACGGSGDTPALTFQSPKDGARFCAKNDLNPATPAVDVSVEIKASYTSEGTQVVLEDDQASFSGTQAIVGGVAAFTVPLVAGNNRLVAHTADNRVVALPPITVTVDTTAPAVTIVKPSDGTVLGATDDADADLSNGFQHDVEVRADVEDGQTAELYVGGILQTTGTFASQRAVFPAVTMPSGSVALEAKVRNACGNEGTDSATITVETGQPTCAIRGFSPAAIVIPSPGPGTVLNISTDADPGTAGMQTSLLVQVTPEAGASAGLAVEVYYGGGASAKATGTTDSTGLATVALDLPDGSLITSARCRDAAGNIGYSQNMPVLVDTVAPDCALALAGAGGAKPSGLFSPADDVDTVTGGVQITATLTSVATDVAGQRVAFAVNGTPVSGSVSVGSGGTAAKDVTIAAGDQEVSATVADVAGNECTVQEQATLVEAGCAVNFTNLTSSSVLNIASDSSGSTGLQHTVTLSVDAACAGQTLTLASSKGVSFQQAVPTGTGLVNMTFANYTVCSGSCQEQVTLTATVEDPASNVTVRTVTLLADNVPPSAVVTFAAPGGTQCGATITPSADQLPPASDGIQVVVTIPALPDRQGLWVMVTNSAGTNRFDPTDAVNPNNVTLTLWGGSNTIVAHVVSGTGNEGVTSPGCSISIQDVLVTFTSPTSGACISTLTPTVTGTVDVAGATVNVVVDGGTPVPAVVTGNSWSVALTLTEGQHTLTANATSSGGKSGTTSETVTVDVTPPDPVTSLAATPMLKAGRAAVNITFNAPTNPSAGCGLKSYLVRYASTPINNATDFAAATPIGPQPGPPTGGAEQATAEHFKVSTPYYFAVVAVDGADNQSSVVSTSSALTLNFTGTSYPLPSVGNLHTGPWYGYSLAVGYLNDDALPDLIVGAPLVGFSGASGFEGAVFVYLGTANGFHATPDFVIRGTAKAMLVGQAVAAVNFDGTGADDLAIGAAGAGTNYGGAVLICKGGTRFAQPTSPPQTIDVSLAGPCEVVITHDSPNSDSLGTGLARANFHGGSDGVDDLVIGSPGSAAGLGEAYVLYGVKDYSWSGVASMALPVTVPSPFKVWQLSYSGVSGTPGMGTYVYSLGKLNGSGDTSEDIGVAGNPADTAYVYYGRGAPTGSVGVIGTGDSSLLKILAEGSGSALGTGMAGIGDTDGDTHNEIVIGAPGTATSAAGRVYVINGGQTGTLQLTAPPAQAPVISIISGASGEHFGQAIANPAPVRLSGDLNGDEYADLVVASGASPWNAYLFYGKTGGFSASLSSSERTWQYAAGGSLPALLFMPDSNGDPLALPDLALGSPLAGDGSVVVLY